MLYFEHFGSRARRRVKLFLEMGTKLAMATGVCGSFLGLGSVITNRGKLPSSNHELPTADVTIHLYQRKIGMKEIKAFTQQCAFTAHLLLYCTEHIYMACLTESTDVYILILDRFINKTRRLRRRRQRLSSPSHRPGKTEETRSRFG